MRNNNIRKEEEEARRKSNGDNHRKQASLIWCSWFVIESSSACTPDNIQRGGSFGYCGFKGSFGAQ